MMWFRLIVAFRRVVNIFSLFASLDVLRWNYRNAYANYRNPCRNYRTASRNYRNADGFYRNAVERGGHRGEAGEPWPWPLAPRPRTAW